MDAQYQPRRHKLTITLILSCSFPVTDRYDLAKEFELRKFEMTVMKMDDLYQLQELAIRLFAQTKAQQSVYESLLRDVGRLPPGQ